MKPLSHLKKTKWIAAVLAVLFGTAAFIGLIAALYTNEMELYQKPLSTVITIIDCREKNKVLPKISNMEYGILKSDSGLLQDTNLTDTNNYIYSNFQDSCVYHRHKL